MSSETFDLGVSRHFKVPAENVFAAWIRPELARQFLFATATGEMVVAEIDARVGGEFNLTDRRPGIGDVAHVGRYLEIEPPQRLVFTVRAEPYQTDDARISILITPQGDACDLDLTVTADVKWREHVERTRAGWTMILDRLAEVVGSDQG